MSLATPSRFRGRTDPRHIAAYYYRLTEGESGIGKELVARQNHELSRRRQRSFVTINYATLVEIIIGRSCLESKSERPRACVWSTSAKLLDGDNPFIEDGPQDYGPNRYMTLECDRADLTETV